MSADLLRECACGCGQPTPLAQSTHASRGHVKGQPIRYIKGHNAKLWTARPVVERFWSKVDKSDGPDACWHWLAGISPQGYGRFAPNRRTIPAHRWAYESVNGPIPVGLVIDHTCGTKWCVNPAHLEAVTTRENNRRAKTAITENRCKRGHDFTPENTALTKDGYRQCRACRRARERSARLV